MEQVANQAGTIKLCNKEANKPGGTTLEIHLDDQYIGLLGFVQWQGWRVIDMASGVSWNVYTQAMAVAKKQYPQG
ncbi:MAG TPA: hypothetical protein VEC17_02755 [Candidatus Binatia bacterium]|nr:hypothetical protein [Candidatus Binatia bacterium]